MRQHWKITFLLLLVAFIATGCFHKGTTRNLGTGQGQPSTVEDINQGEETSPEQADGEGTEPSSISDQENTTDQTNPPVASQDTPSEEEMKKLQNDIKRAIQGMDSADDFYDDVTSEVEEFYAL